MVPATRLSIASVRPSCMLLGLRSVAWTDCNNVVGFSSDNAFSISYSTTGQLNAVTGDINSAPYVASVRCELTEEPRVNLPATFLNTAPAEGQYLVPNPRCVCFPSTLHTTRAYLEEKKKKKP